METYIIHPKDKEQSRVLEAFLKALQVPFEASNKSPYNSEFVAKILDGKKEFEEGKSKTIKTNEELKSFIGVDES